MSRWRKGVMARPLGLLWGGVESEGRSEKHARGMAGRKSAKPAQPAQTAQAAQDVGPDDHVKKDEKRGSGTTAERFSSTGE